MHVTARLAGQEEVDVEVGEECRTSQALKEAVVVALPQLRVERFDVSVGGRALDDEGVGGFSGVTTARSSRACEMALRLFGAGCTNCDGRAGPPDVGRVVPGQPLGRNAGFFLGGVCPLKIQEAGGREHPGQVGSPIESSAAWLFFKRP